MHVRVSRKPEFRTAVTEDKKVYWASVQLVWHKFVFASEEPAASIYRLEAVGSSETVFYTRQHGLTSWKAVICISINQTTPNWP